MGVNVADAPFDKNYPNVDRLLFYWTPDFPELMVKQAHVVAKFAHHPENLWLRDLIKKLGMGNTSMWNPNGPSNLTKDSRNKGDYQRSIVPLIYSSATEIFQCQKSKVTFMPLQHNWFYTLHKDTPVYQLIDSDFRLFFKTLNKKYLKMNNLDIVVGFKPFIHRYKIGDYTKFTEQSL